jgi:Protein of unknown function (DUF732)
VATQMRYSRLLGFAAITGPLLAAGVAWAGPAQADATSYLNDLRNAGIQDVNGGDTALLQTGQKLCVQIGYGVSPGQLKAMALQRSDAKLGANGLTPQQANEVVNYAIVDLCPDY